MSSPAIFTSAVAGLGGLAALVAVGREVVRRDAEHPSRMHLLPALVLLVLGGALGLLVGWTGRLDVWDGAKALYLWLAAVAGVTHLHASLLGLVLLLRGEHRFRPLGVLGVVAIVVAQALWLFTGVDGTRWSWLPVGVGLLASGWVFASLWEIRGGGGQRTVHVLAAVGVVSLLLAEWLRWVAFVSEPPLLLVWDAAWLIAGFTAAGGSPRRTGRAVLVPLLPVVAWLGLVQVRPASDEVPWIGRGDWVPDLPWVCEPMTWGVLGETVVTYHEDTCANRLAGEAEGAPGYTATQHVRRGARRFLVDHGRSWMDAHVAHAAELDRLYPDRRTVFPRSLTRFGTEHGERSLSELRLELAGGELAIVGRYGVGVQDLLWICDRAGASVCLLEVQDPTSLGGMR